MTSFEGVDGTVLLKPSPLETQNMRQAFIFEFSLGLFKIHGTHLDFHSL